MKNREVLKMAGFLLDDPARRCVGTLATDDKALPCSTCVKSARAWSLEGAVIVAAMVLRKRALEALADLAALFGTDNVASHWDGSLKCPRWTQDEMVDKLKSL